MRELNAVEWAVRPLTHYADFKGRAPRAEYWWFYLMTVILSIPLGLLDKALSTRDILETILNLVLLVPWLAVTVRRLHDTNRGGGWLFVFTAVIALIALVGAGAFGLTSASTAIGYTGLIIIVLLILVVAVTFLVFMVLPGTDGPNNYGPDPYGPDELEEVFA